jgi:hypothetical protein
MWSFGWKASCLVISCSKQARLRRAWCGVSFVCGRRRCLACCIFASIDWMYFARLHERFRCYEQLDELIGHKFRCKFHVRRCCEATLHLCPKYHEEPISQFGSVNSCCEHWIDDETAVLFVCTINMSIKVMGCGKPRKLSSGMSNAFDSDILRDRIMLVLPNPIPFPS